MKTDDFDDAESALIMFLILIANAFLLSLVLVLLGCTVAREGSTVVRVQGATTNTAPVIINAAANGATAQHADRRGTTDAKSTGALSLASRWWLWALIGVAICVIGYLVWRFVFTGAKLALLS